MFYPLAGTRICKERTLAMVFSVSIVYRSYKCRNLQTGVSEIALFEISFLRPLLVFFADNK